MKPLFRIGVPPHVVRDLKLLFAVFKRFGTHEGTVLCGYIAYSAMLAGLPFLIFTVALTGALIGEASSDQAVAAMFDALPEHVARTLEPVLIEVLGQRSGGILTISAAGTVWAASNGVEALRIALDRAYDVGRPRGYVQRRLVAIAFVFVGFLTFASLGVLIILAPLVQQLLETWTTLTVPVGTDVIRYAAGAAVLFIFLWLLHRMLPSRQMAGMTLWPGILISVLAWGVIATCLSVYLAYAPSYALTYGALAGVIVTLLFFYLTGAAIILGAEVNALFNGIEEREGKREDEGAPSLF